jgi:membrane dipeptidase
MNLLLLLLPALAAPPSDEALRARVEKILARTPLIDGHNDVPWAYRDRVGRQLDALPFGTGTADLDPPMHTDLPRLRAGRVGGVFWSVWIPTDLEGADANRALIEQIDVVHRMVERWPGDLTLATTAAGVRRAHRDRQIASLIGIEGGHSLGGSLAVLRDAHRSGARYLTLTHWKTTDWADAATDAPRHDGLSPFGVEVVAELNRLGMLVDLAHVSAATMHDALDASAAPVIFSHSGAFAVNPHPRNVPDDVLRRLPQRDGVVMVDFLPSYVSAEVHRWHAAKDAEEARAASLHLGDAAGAEAALNAWIAVNPEPRATLAQVADHIDHIRAVIGAKHVGLGSDFDGMNDAPDGLDDASAFPALLVELARRGYTDEELAGIAGENVLRVMEAAEAVAARLDTERFASEADLESP